MYIVYFLYQNIFEYYSNQYILSRLVVYHLFQTKNIFKKKSFLFYYFLQQLIVLHRNLSVSFFYPDFSLFKQLLLNSQMD